MTVTLELNLRLRPVRQAAEEAQALLQLLDADELVGRVGLGDVAGAADDGRRAAVLEQAGLRAVGDREGLVLPGELAGSSGTMPDVVSAA